MGDLQNVDSRYTDADAIGRDKRERLSMGNVKSVVKTVYDGFKAGDMDKVTSVMSPDIIWNEAQGNPYADRNPYNGPEEILTGLFARLGTEWEEFSAVPAEYVAEGERVIVFGRYGGKHLASGRSQDVPFVHSWTVEDGKITAFQQYTDTAQLVSIMGES